MAFLFFIHSIEMLFYNNKIIVYDQS